MFKADIYKKRREILKKQVGHGVIIFLGNDESPMNYAGNTYHFRQDSTFLYYFGLDFPGLSGIIDYDENRDIIFGDELTMDDIIWMGFQPTLKERSLKAEITDVLPLSKLKQYLQKTIENKRRIHFIPQYRTENLLKLEDLLGIHHKSINSQVSEELIKAIVDQRSVKIPEEIEQIKHALDISWEMHTFAMKQSRAGQYERDICGKVQGIAASMGGEITSFPVIFSVHGETLHNHYHGNKMENGHLVVHDSGAESILHYASDITRTFPVSGRFSTQQKEIYEIVLESQLTAIEAIKPGVKYRDVHMLTAKVIAEGMKNLGLMKGNTSEAVDQGAHALFFPHGLGHMIGLDVHDMENLGENYVGYDQKTKRSEQFGLAYLRMGRELKSGFVMTVEPGIYFIPALIDQWKKEKKFTQFINYDKVDEYKNFGGVRIEDDVLVTEKGHEVLGKPIPKTIKEVEDTCNL